MPGCGVDSQGKITHRKEYCDFGFVLAVWQ